MRQHTTIVSMGKSRSSIANILRLLELSGTAKQSLLQNKITEGHARSLLRFKDHADQNKVLDMILKNSLSVRQAEQLSLDAPIKREPTHKTKNLLSGCRYKTTYTKSSHKGSFTVHFSSEEEFNQLQALLLNA